MLLALLDAHLELAAVTHSSHLVQGPLAARSVLVLTLWPAFARDNAPPSGARDPQALLLPLPATHEATPPKPHDVGLVSAQTGLESILKAAGRSVGMGRWCVLETRKLVVERVQAAWEREEGNGCGRDKGKQRDPRLRGLATDCRLYNSQSARRRGCPEGTRRPSRYTTRGLATGPTPIPQGSKGTAKACRWEARPAPAVSPRDTAATYAVRAARNPVQSSPES